MPQHREQPRPERVGRIVLRSQGANLVDEPPLELDMGATARAHRQVRIDRRKIHLAELAVEVIPERADGGLAIR